MIDRHAVGLIPPKPHSVCRTKDGALVYEEMFTRGGFEGPFTSFYHRHPITPARRVEASPRGFPKARAHEGATFPLKRRLYDANEAWKKSPGTTLFDSRLPLLFNDDVTLSVARVTQDDDVLFANNDGDELHFVREGGGTFETVCGRLSVTAGDYVLMPRSLIHRFLPGRSGASLFTVEAKRDCFIPAQFRNAVGQLVMGAPYTHRDFKRPEGPIATEDREPTGPTELIAKRDDRFTRLTLERTPLDVLGWDGFVYPFAFPISKYQARTGHYHLPPTVHATFAGGGFLVCSFVPRTTDFGENAIPCPYPHSNPSCDEVILYLSGNFTSRRGVGPGCISLHPGGVAHGPHPGAYEASIGAKSTEETAVMIDVWKGLSVTEYAVAAENTGYHDSWRTEHP